MPDAACSVHRPPFDYYHPVYRAAAAEAKARSRGHCQNCGRPGPLHAHHWGKPYPPPEKTTVADLTALCVTCHTLVHLARLFEEAGGPPEVLCGAWSETVADLLLQGLRLPGGPTRVGRAVRVEGQWIALVTGRLRPAVGEVVALFLRSMHQWRPVVVTAVLDGHPGRWRVRKDFCAPTRSRQCPRPRAGSRPDRAFQGREVMPRIVLKNEYERSTSDLGPGSNRS